MSKFIARVYVQFFEIYTALDFVHFLETYITFRYELNSIISQNSSNEKKRTQSNFFTIFFAGKVQ